MEKSRFKLGPGILVTAAFIGPGTITTASLTGANYGFALCWALLFSVLATYTLQEMTARLGIVTGRGLAENLRHAAGETWFGRIAVFLVIMAIGFGNAAYEAGNITGAALGIQAVLGLEIMPLSLAVGAIAGGLLLSGHYLMIERVTMVLVLLMSAVFVLTVLMVRPPVPGELALQAATGN